MSGNSFIDKIIDTLFGYVSEKRIDSISSKFRDIFERNNIKEEINKQLKIALDEFKDSSKDEEFVFDGLTETLKDFSTKNFLEAYALAFSEPDKLEKAKEQIIRICIINTQAETAEAKNNVKNIINNSFNIVEHSLIGELSNKDLTQIGLINQHTKEIVLNSVNDIIKHDNENTQKIIDKIQSPTSSSSNNELLFDTLKQGRELSAAYLEDLGTHGRFKGYNETNGKRITIENKIKTNNYSNKSYKLYELVFEIVPQKSISLHGKGGTGKTFQLLSLYNLIINLPNESNNLINKIKNCIPFYIELNNLNGYETLDTNCILAELENNLNRLKKKRKCPFSVTNDQLIQILQDQGNNVILMLDGYNEVTDESRRKSIAKDIAEILNNYKTKIILTSRLDHSHEFGNVDRGTFLNNTFEKAEVQPCSDKQVDEYFSKLGIIKTYCELTEAERRLVETAQGLSMYGELLINDPNSNFNNLGTLLQTYVEKIFFKNWTDVKKQPFWKYLEEIAYKMVLDGQFNISEIELTAFLSSNEFKNKYGIVTVDDIMKNEDIKNIFADDSNDDYEFTHQNFRDMYCALYLNQKLTDAIYEKQFIKSNLVTNNDEILELCGNLLKKQHIIQPLINNLKNIQRNIDESKISPIDYSFTLLILIRIFAFQNKNNIHKLNLENLDLSKVPLSRYTLYSPNDHGYDCITLQGATVSEDTFESNGLKRGSSTICKYTKDNNNYIVAFCSDNLVIYDTTTAKWKSIRYQFQDTEIKFGWINCACNIEEEQKIILGTDNGFVTFFSYKDEPYINTDPQQYLEYDAIYKSQKREKLCCIESIVQFKDENHKTIILASNSAGEIFVLDDKKIIKSSNYPEIYSVQKQFYDDYELEKFSVCKLTVNNQYMFYSWENKIFQCKLSKNIHFTRWTTLKQPCIFDIYCTNEYLFVNTGKEILVFSIANKENIASYSYSPQNDNITRHDQLNRFTKLSKFENLSDTVIIGTSAEDQDRNTIPSYIVLSVYNSRTDESYQIHPQGINGIGQTMTTFSAVTFAKNNPNNDTTHTFIATTSNDRTIQILSANIEDLSATKHYGTYDGIHHIEIISQTELLLSQYDGSVSHWEYNKNNQEWLCKDVYPIHKDWVWKARYYNDKYFFSCSYDGTVKRTNMITYETDTLIEDNDKIIDLALVSKEEKLYIYAVTEEKIIVYCLNDAKKDYIQFKDSDNLYTQYTGTAKYAIKSISHVIGEDSNKLLLAVNFYSNGQKDLSNLSKIYELDISNGNKIKDILAINGQSLNNYIKIDDLTTHNDSLIITGQRQIEKEKSEQIDVYESKFETYNFSKIKSLSDFEERRIIYITFKEGNIFIGCLDGSVFILEKENITAQRTISPTFLTHADLIAISSIDMKGVKWNNDQHKDRFKGYFKNL